MNEKRPFSDDRNEFLVVGGVLASLALLGAAANYIPETADEKTDDTAAFELPTKPVDINESEVSADELAFSVAQERLHAQAISLAHDVLDQLENPNYGAESYPSSTPDGAFGFPSSITNKAFLAGPDEIFDTPDDETIYPEVRVVLFTDKPHADTSPVVQFLSVNYADPEQNPDNGFHSIDVKFFIDQSLVKDYENATIKQYRSLLSSDKITLKSAAVGFSSNYLEEEGRVGDSLFIENKDGELTGYDANNEIQFEDADSLNQHLDSMKATASKYKQVLPK